MIDHPVTIPEREITTPPVDNTPNNYNHTHTHVDKQHESTNVSPITNCPDGRTTSQIAFHQNKDTNDTQMVDQFPTNSFFIKKRRQNNLTFASKK